MATSIRHQRQPTLNLNLLAELHDMLTIVNPFVSLYQNMRTMCNEYEQRQGNNQESISVQVIIGQNLQGHEGRYNLPNAHEIAAVFDDNQTSATFTRDVIVYSRLCPGESCSSIIRSNGESSGIYSTN
ncbi:hypothetical protein HMI54_009332 [Coelomomyces lativittatus]|nr:hypothetical protein HMI54_009332 [Coelomomyces lativittatus]